MTGPTGMPPGPPPPPPPPPPPYPPVRQPSPGPRIGVILAVLLVLVVLVAAGVVGLVVGLRNGDSSSATSRPGSAVIPATGTSPTGSITDADRASATSFAEQALGTVLGYSSSSFDADVQSSAALMTPSYAAKYRSTMTGIRSTVVQQHATVTAEATDVGLTGIATDSATLLAFVRQTSQRDGASQPSITPSWVALSLQRSAGSWLIDDMDTAAAPDRPGEPSSDRRAAMTAARRMTLALLDVDYRNPERSRRRVLAMSTGSFAREYRNSVAALTRLLAKQHATQTGTVLDTGIADYAPSRAAVLVTATSKVSTASSGPQARNYRIRITLTRVGGRWLTSDLAYVS